MSELRPVDVRSLLRLMREVAQIPAATGERETHLLRALCKEIRAEVGLLFHAEAADGADVPIRNLVTYQVRVEEDAEDSPPPRHPELESLAKTLASCRSGRPSFTCQAFMSEQPWNREFKGSAHEGKACQNCLISSTTPNGTNRLAILSFHKPWRDAGFSARERRLTDVFWSEAAKLVPYSDLGVGGVRGDVDTKLEAVPSLPPRLRQVLQGLLEGRSAGEIAHDLDLSKHTIRDHIKRLHRVFKVSSQAELLAMCAGRQPRPTASTSEV